MKRFIKFFLVFYILLALIHNESSYSIDILSSEANLLKEQLKVIGIEDKYSKNIVSYLINLNISKEKLDNVIESGEEIKTLVEDKKSINDFKTNEIYNVYKKASTIANQLNLNLSYNFFEKSLSIKDKSNNTLLIEADYNEVENYIANARSFVSEESIDKIASIFKGEIQKERDNLYISDNIEIEYEKKEIAKENSSQDEAKDKDDKKIVKSNDEFNNGSKKAKEVDDKSSPTNEDNEVNLSGENTLAFIMGISLLGAMITFIMILSKVR